jgi:hypothetical protein
VCYAGGYRTVAQFGQGLPDLERDSLNPYRLARALARWCAANGGKSHKALTARSTTAYPPEAFAAVYRDDNPEFPGFFQYGTGPTSVDPTPAPASSVDEVKRDLAALDARLGTRLDELAARLDAFTVYTREALRTIAIEVNALKSGGRA